MREENATSQFEMPKERVSLLNPSSINRDYQRSRDYGNYELQCYGLLEYMQPWRH